MDMKMIWKWLYVGGAVVAALAGAFAFKNDILTWLLIIVGILTGLFYQDSADLMNFGIRYLALNVAYVTLGGLIAPVGTFLVGFFGGFVGFLGPVVVAMAVMFFVKKYFSM